VDRRHNNAHFTFAARDERGVCAYAAAFSKLHLFNSVKKDTDFACTVAT